MNHNLVIRRIGEEGERLFRGVAEKNGYEVFPRLGMPDFLIVKDGYYTTSGTKRVYAFVEVKNEGGRLKSYQADVMGKLEEMGFPCYLWKPVFDEWPGKRLFTSLTAKKKLEGKRCKSCGRYLPTGKFRERGKICRSCLRKWRRRRFLRRELPTTEELVAI